MGRIWGSDDPDMRLGEPFISVFLVSITTRSYYHSKGLLTPKTRLK
jgi:hypothetical protein